MDWDSKIPSWDMEEGLVRNVEPNQFSMEGQAGGSRVADCSVDLKLGGLGDFRALDKSKDQHRASSSTKAIAQLASPSKRARPPSGAVQNVSCLVDDCKADLSGCREYHRRHKVCEAHSKTPVVVVGGQEQRFCQQCSRFHMLVEFDEVKRSCRKRLDGHNRRRRKPQPESINSGSLFLNHQGVRFSTCPHILPTPVPEPNWAGIVKTEDETLYNRQSPLQAMNSQPHFPGSFSRCYKEGKQISFLQDGDAAFTRMTAESSACQPTIKTISAAGSSNSKVFPDGLPQVLDSDCALSLLSSATQTSSISMGQMLPAERIPMAHPLVPSQPYLGMYSSSQTSSNVSATEFLCPRIEDEPVGTVLDSDTDGDLHCHDIFHVGDEGTSDGNSHVIPFSWQ